MTYSFIVTTYPAGVFFWAWPLSVECGYFGFMSQPPPSSTSVLLPTGACSGRHFLIVSLSLYDRFMMKTPTAAVTCEDIFHLNLRPWACVAATTMLSKSPRIFPDTQLHLSVCRSDIQSLILSVLEIKMCLAGMASRSLRNLLSFLSSCLTRTTSLTFAQEQCGSTGASTMWVHNQFLIWSHLCPAWYWSFLQL